MKKLKQRFELVGRLLLVFTTLFTNFAGIMPVLASDLGYTKGEVIDSVNSDGNIVSQGDAMITKTVRSTNEEGVYQIDLSVKGKDKVTSESTTASIYAAVVLDTSGSMEDKVCVDGGFIFCKKWEDIKYPEAVKGTKDFANTLLSKYPSAQLALVTFSSGANVLRNFSNSNFDNVSYPEPSGATYLSDGINTAKGLLDAKKKADPNAKLYMVIISDGYPEEYKISNEAAANKAKVSAATAKKNNIEIFTIGYDTTEETQELLKNVATDENHYSNADGNIVIEGCSFDSVAEPINIKHKGSGTATYTVTDCTFNDCGSIGNDKAWAAPIRFVEDTGAGSY